MAVLEACGVICIIASVFLSVLGSLSIFEYEYIAFKGYEAGMTCIYAAGIYLLILFMVLAMKYRHQKTFHEEVLETHSDSSDEDAPFIKLKRKKFLYRFGVCFIFYNLDMKIRSYFI
jgi:uncharacterized membrane protein